MAGKTSKSQEGYYAKYKSGKTWEKNRIRRLERTLKAQPNNEQVKLALKGLVYRRKTPTNRMWPASWVRIAKLFKEVEGRFDPNIMSANVDLVRTALQRQSKVSVELIRNKSKPVQEFKSMFSLEARLQGIK
jgi:hypothetical protein